MTEQERLMHERFEELLPWYVNGTLGATEREWVEGYLHSYPDAGSELRWHQFLQSGLKENAPVVSPDIGLDEALGRIRQERRARAPDWMERVRGFFSSFRLTPAMATALGIIVLQAAVITSLLPTSLQPNYAEVRSAGRPDTTEGPLLRVNFKPDAKESEMRLLLISVGGTLVAGPGQLGDYFVRVPTDKINQALDKLTASGLVDAVDVAQTLPGER